MRGFEAIMNMKAEDVKPPPPLPTGWYVAMTEGLPVNGKSANAGAEQWQFKAKIMQPFRDVDPEALEDWAQETGEPVMGQNRYITFYDNSSWRLTAFLVNLKLGGLPVKQGIQESPGRQFLLEIRHRPHPNGKTLLDQTGDTAPLP